MQAFRPDEKIPPSHESEPVPPPNRKHVLTAQASPDSRQTFDSFSRWRSGIICAIHCADARAHHQVGVKAMAHERAQHPDLDRAEAASSGKDEGRFRSRSIQGLHDFCYRYDFYRSVLKGIGFA